MNGQALGSVSVSFLVPVKNGASTLSEALDSIAGQADEIVVVDDHSEDDSAAIARRAGALVVPNPGHGLVSALNAGLEACSGDWVARMDADDRASADRIAQQRPYFADHTVIDGQVRFSRTDGAVGEGMRQHAAWINRVLTPDDFDRALLIESPVVHPAATFRRDAVQAIGGYRHGPFPEDYDLWLRLHAAGHRFCKVPAVLVEMRDHDARLTRTDPRYDRHGFRRARFGWLERTVLSQPRRVVFWGAGKECRPWVRWLTEQGHTLVAVLDIAKRGSRGGAPIVAPEALASLDAEVCLVGVGARGARAQIRVRIASLRPDWREGRDWWAVR